MDSQNFDQDFFEAGMSAWLTLSSLMEDITAEEQSFKDLESFKSLYLMIMQELHAHEGDA
jgi:hypothetical protein